MSKLKEDSIVQILVRLADAKYCLGRRYGHWCCSGPTLEASVAAASMAGDEVGHARVLYPLFRKLENAPKEMTVVSDRTDFKVPEFLKEDWDSWTDFIAISCVFDTAMTVVLESLKESSFEFFSSRVSKMLQEENYHEIFSFGWFGLLSEEVKDDLKKSVEKIYPETIKWLSFEDKNLMKIAKQEQVINKDSDELVEAFESKIQSLMESLN
tara:strand:+ start:1475 stop:2107 length:633 start_codon:yes stop_codon:yes gene_type:complete